MEINIEMKDDSENLKERECEDIRNFKLEILGSEITIENINYFSNDYMTEIEINTSNGDYIKYYYYEKEHCYAESYIIINDERYNKEPDSMCNRPMIDIFNQYKEFLKSKIFR